MINELFMAAIARNAIRSTARGTGLAAQALTKASEARAEIDFIKMDIEKLLLISEALWVIVKQQHGFSDEDLIRKIQEVDLRDGKLDGKVAKQSPSACPNCKRTLMKSRPMCLYCGAPVNRDPFKK